MDIKELYQNISESTNIVWKYFIDPSFDDFFKRKGHEVELVGQTSIRFASKNESALQTLRRVFNLKNTASKVPNKNLSLFKTCFLQAVYGEGNEISEITQLNSSALISLMCFYPISPLNPLKLIIDNKMMSFTSILLEKENPVFSANHPSSIDIALYGEDESHNPIVLFLESKFSEYLTPGDFISTSGKSYAEDYERIMSTAKAMNVLNEIDFKADDTGSSVTGKTHYCHGLKQMVSHYIGARNSYELNKEGRVVYLGTILYDFTSHVDDARRYIDDYRNQYRELASVLNEISKEDNHNTLHVVKEVWTYQKFFGNFKLDSDVKRFYQL